MSGMQKSVLTENVESLQATYDSLKAKLDSMSTSDPEFDTIHAKTSQAREALAKTRRSERDLPMQSLKAKQSEVTDKAAMSAIGKPRISAGQAGYRKQLLGTADQAFLNDRELKARKARILAKRSELAAKLGNPSKKEVADKLVQLRDLIKVATKELEAAPDKEAAAKLRLNLKKLVKEQSDWHELRQADANLSAQLAALDTEDRTDTAGARRQGEQALNALQNLKGMSRAEKQITLDNLGITDDTALVYKERPDASIPKVLTFNEMITVAKNKAIDDGNLVLFFKAIEGINDSMAQILGQIRDEADKTSFIFTNPDAKNIFNKVSSKAKGSQTDADLVKVIWLYLGGEETFNKAKSTPQFITALEKLEKTSGSTVTKPISQVNTLEEMFNSDELKSLFQSVRDDAMSIEERDNLAADVTDIIEAPPALYTGLATTEQANIADTLYYAIVNSFGTPEDKVKLLKRSEVGSGGEFLSNEALALAKKERENLEDFFQGKKVLGASGRKGGARAKGDREKLGQKVRNMFKAVPSSYLDPSVATEGSSESEKLADSTIAEGMDFTKSSTAGAIREAFNSGITLDKLTSLLSQHFAGVLQSSLKDTSESYAASGNAAKSAIYKKALELAKSTFDDVLESVKKLTKEDLTSLSKVFEASHTTGEATDNTEITWDEITNTFTDSGQIMLDYAEDILNAINEFETEAPKENKPEKVKSYSALAAKDIEEAQDEVDVLTKELATTQSQLDALTAAGTPEAEADAQDLRLTISSINADLTHAQDRLDSLKDSSVAGSSPEVEASRGSKDFTKFSKLASESDTARQARRTKEILGPLVANAKEHKLFDAKELYTATQLAPQDILDYLPIGLREDATEAFDALFDTSVADMEKIKWQDKVRAALKGLTEYMNTPDVRKDESRYTAMTSLMASFRSELEKASSMTEMTKKERDKAQKKLDKARAKAEKKTEALKKLAVGEDETGDKKLDAAADRAILNKQTLIPGSAFSGTPQIMEKSALNHVLIGNLKRLEPNAQEFYELVKRVVKNLGLTDKAANDEFMSANSPEFMDNLLELITFFKVNLSTSVEASDIENELFLSKLVQDNELSLTKKKTDGGKVISRTRAHLDSEDIRTTIENSPYFTRLADQINQAQETGSIAWPTKVVNAPVIGFGEKTLSLKTATILNLLGGVKNFESINMFDLSLNRRNKDILSTLFNTNTYPATFSAEPSTALIMKIFFLSQLIKAVNGAKVIEKFSGDFINVDIPLNEGDKVAKMIKDQLEVINKTFESTVLAELMVDLGPGGTLDSELDHSIELLKTIADSIGGNVYIIDRTYRTKLEPLPANVQEFAIEQGELMSTYFLNSIKPNKLTAATQNLITSLSANENSEAQAAKTLENCISIIKTGITFHCGYEAIKAVAMHELYDPETRRVDSRELQSRLEAFKSRPEFVGFTEKFVTEEVKDETGEATGEVTTKQVAPGSAKQGYSNLNNAFLSSFLRDFTYNALTSAIAEADVEEFEKASSDETAEAARTAHAELENNTDVFIRGLFKKNTTQVDIEDLRKRIASAEEQIAKLDPTKENERAALQLTINDAQEQLDSAVVDIDSEEGQKEIAAKNSAAKAAAKKIGKSAKPKAVAPVSITQDKSGDVKIYIKLKPKGTYTDVTREIAQGHSMSMTTGEKSGGRKSIQNLRQLGEIVTDFSTSLMKISEVLNNLYANKPKTAKAVAEYARTVQQSAPHLKTAVQTITMEPFDPEVQKIAVAALQQMNATEVPDVLILKDPAKAKTLAKEAFADDGPFHPIFSFADKVAGDIVAGKTNMAKVYEALNSVIAAGTAPGSTLFASTGLPTATVKPVADTLGSEGLNTIAKSFFSGQMTEEAADLMLSNVKASIGGLDNKGEREQKLAASAAKLKTLITAKTAKEQEIAAIRAKIGPMEAAATKSAGNTSSSDWASKNVPAEVTAAKRELSTRQAEVDKINQDISAETANQQAINTAVGTPAVAIPMVKFLQKLHAEGTRQLASYINTIKKDEVTKKLSQSEKAMKTYRELTPIQARTPLVINFINNLVKESNGSHAANAVLKGFNDLAAQAKAAPVFTNVKESIASEALKAFKLLEEVIESHNFKMLSDEELPSSEAELSAYYRTLVKYESDTQDYIKAHEASMNPQQLETAKKELAVVKRQVNTVKQELDTMRSKYNITDKEYIISMAKYLAEEQKVKKAEDYLISIPDPDSSLGEMIEIPGIERSVIAATTLNLVDNPIFKGYRLGINSDVMLGITAKVSNGREDLKIPFTDFYSIKRIAQHDIPFIEEYANPIIPE